jgi:hypothetical protein
MAQDRFQGSRFEQKYIITEEVSLQIRDYVRSYLELDEHAVGKPNFSYSVHSVYLDSDDLKLYWATINGDKSRFKLRLRFYDDNPHAAVFLEIKELTSIKRPVKKSAPVIKIKELTNNGCHIKKRAPVHRDAVDGLLTGQTDDPSRVTDPKHFGALEDFCERMYELEARPKVHVAYFREAYMQPDDNSFRLTIDREVRVAPVPPPSPEKEQSGPAVRLSTAMENPILIWGRDVVLEFKFTKRFPDLFRDLLRIFGLRQCGAAKYVDGVASLGEYNLPG